MKLMMLARSQQVDIMLLLFFQIILFRIRLLRKWLGLGQIVCVRLQNEGVLSNSVSDIVTRGLTIREF